MPEKRFFIDTPFQKGQTIEIQGEELHHLRVMRIEKGNHLELINGKNQLAIARCEDIEKRNACLTLEEITEKEPLTPKIILAQAITRPKNLELIIEKGTELGASAFWLFPGDRSDPKPLTPHQLQRLHIHAISALKQCGRLDLPPIEIKPPLSNWEKPSEALFFGDLTKEAPALKPATSDTLIFIGPEKGYSDQELYILSNTLSASGIQLNPNILRAETAAITALSILRSVF